MKGVREKGRELKLTHGSHKEKRKEEHWEHYLDGFKRLKKLRRKNSKEGQDFMFFNMLI